MGLICTFTKGKCLTINEYPEPLKMVSTRGGCGGAVEQSTPSLSEV